MRAVIFDLDGVLVRTDQAHDKAWRALAGRLGIPFDGRAAARLRGVSRMEARDIALEGCGQKLPYEGDAKGDVIVGVRPEHVKYAEAGKGTLNGVVKSHFYLGDVDDCRIDLGGGKELRIIADPYESVGVEAGKAIELDVRNFLVYPAEQPGEGLFPQLSDALLRHEPAAVENGEFEERIAYIDDEIHNSRSVL